MARYDYVNEPGARELVGELAKINDETTGINLLRGTRDFVLGSTQFEDTSNIGYKDGFSPSSFDFTKDEDGFTVATTQNDSSTVFAIITSLVPVKENEIVTVSFDVKLDKTAEHNLNNYFATIEFFEPNNTSRNAYQDIFANTFGISDDFGVWHSGSLIFNKPHKDGYIRIRAYHRNGQHISFRKFKIERDSVNNPVWSPSPFDIDYINDETTGINLLRGTRDFVAGSEDSITIGGSFICYENGLKIHNNASAVTINKPSGNHVSELIFDADKLSNTNNTTNAIINMNYINIENITKDDSFTVSFDIFYSEDSLLPNNRIDSLAIRSKSNLSGNLAGGNHERSSYGISPSIKGEWQKAKYVFRPNIETEDVVLTFLLQLYIQSGYVKVKNLLIYKGSINNPIWSPSPFDVAQSNDLHPTIDLGLIDDDKRIQENEDLNTYTQAGTYACVATDIAKKVLNSPTGNAFKLYVDKTSGGNSNYIRQIVIAYSALNSVYLRFSSNGGSTWSNWQDTRMFQAVRSIDAGGTGGGTAREASYNLLSDIAPGDDSFGDTDLFICDHNAKSKENGALKTKKASAVWDWIKTKIESIFFKDVSTMYPLRFGYHSGTGSVYYGVFCKIKIPEPTQNLSIQFLASNFSNYGSRSNGVYIIEVSGRGSTADNIPEDCMKVTCLSEPVKYFNDVKFWYYLDSESYLNFGFTTTTFPAGAKFTTIGSSVSPDLAEIGKLYYSTKKPSEDLTEVKVVPPYTNISVATVKETISYLQS